MPGQDVVPVMEPVYAFVQHAAVPEDLEVLPMVYAAVPEILGFVAHVMAEAEGNYVKKH